MSEAPRAYTKEEVRENFLQAIRSLPKYWANVDNGYTTEEKISGAFHSFLSLLDGSSHLPCFDLVLRPHHDDKDFHIEEGENYYEDGMVINDDCLLHEIFYKRIMTQ
jgi:hypothetical protein